MKKITDNPEIVNFFLTIKLNKFMYEPEFKVAKAYTIGLIKSEKKPKLKVISYETGMNIVDLSMFLNKDYQYWDNKKIFNEIIINCEENGELVLDTVVFAKENTTKTKTRKVHASSLKRNVDGLEFLVMLYVKEKTVKVVGLKLISKRPEIITESVNMIESYLTFKTIDSVKADNHFFHQVLIDFLNEKEIGFISKPRRNGTWNDEMLKECFAAISEKSFRYYPQKQVYAKALILKHEKYGWCKIILVKSEYHSIEKNCFYVVSTDLELSVMMILKGKKTRWKIETVFRDCNQNLGLKCCQCVELGSITNHVFMVFLTYNFLSGLKEKYGGTIGKIKRKISPYISTTTSISTILEVKCV